MWTIASFGVSTNPTLDYQALALWSLVELDVGIICACMPGVASLMRRMLPSVFGSTKGTSSGNSGQNTIWGSESDRFRRIESPTQKRIHKTTDFSVSYGTDTIQDSKDEEHEFVEYETVSRKESQRQLRPPQLDLPHLEGQYTFGADLGGYREKW